MALKTVNVAKAIMKEVQCKDLYSVSFDLENKKQDSYDIIEKVLEYKSTNAIRVTESQWIVRWPDTTAGDLRKYLWSCKVRGNRLFVRGDDLNIIAVEDYAGFKIPPKF